MEEKYELTTEPYPYPYPLNHYPGQGNIAT